jgi:hypothetical protein
MTQSICVLCDPNDCPNPVAWVPPIQTLVRLSQTWADLRVDMAETFPEDDPRTKDSWLDLEQAVGEAYRAGAPNATAQQVEAYVSDFMGSPQDLTLHRLIYYLDQGVRSLRRSQ